MSTRASLMDQARALLASPVGQAALAIVPLAVAAPAHAGVSFSLTNAEMQVVTSGYAGSYNFAAVSGTPAATVGIAPLSNGSKLFGNELDGDTTTDRALRVFGAQLDNAAAQGNGQRIFRLHMQGTFQFDAPPNPGEFFRVAFEYGFDFATGQAREMGPNCGFGLAQADGTPGVFWTPYNTTLFGMGIGFGEDENTVGPGGYGSGFAFNFDNDFGFDAMVGLNQGTWEVNLPFEWTGYEPEDAFTLHIPANSIDLTVVPTPGAAGLMALAGLAAARRRR